MDDESGIVHMCALYWVLLSLCTSLVQVQKLERKKKHLVQKLSRSQMELVDLDELRAHVSANLQACDKTFVIISSCTYTM